ncbi:MAG: glycosyltransferase [Longimicrobiales bacterium]|nr:glycosyltransferase [Longimicrobiales bacterium]
MRIALFTDTFPPTLNGVARAMGLLVEHAARAGHEVGVVSPRVADADCPDAAFHIQLPGVALPFYRELQAARPWLGGRHRRTLERFRPQVVHAGVEALVGGLGRRWARRHRLPLVTSYCTNFPEYLAGYGLGRLEGAAWAHLRRFHAAADLTVCPSAATLAALRERGFHGRLGLWGRGVDGELFHPARRDPDLRLVEDNALRARLRRQARARAETHTWEAVFERLFRSYAEIIQERDGSVTAPVPDPPPAPVSFASMEPSQGKRT